MGPSCGFRGRIEVDRKLGTLLWLGGGNTVTSLVAFGVGRFKERLPGQAVPAASGGLTPRSVVYRNHR